jgi:hypothetical protein
MWHRKSVQQDAPRRENRSTQGERRRQPRAPEEAQLHWLTNESPSRATGRVTCPNCRSRLEIFETPSGGRTVSVIALGANVDAKALERFMAPGDGPEVVCPACNLRLDPASPYRGESRR